MHALSVRGAASLVVDVEPLEQRLVALEQLLEGVDEQTPAKAARARQEVALAAVDQALDVLGRRADPNIRLMYLGIQVRTPHSRSRRRRYGRQNGNTGRERTMSMIEDAMAHVDEEAIAGTIVR